MSRTACAPFASIPPLGSGELNEQAQFSLAGATVEDRPSREGDCWDALMDRVPTSRILKVASRRSADQEITEQVR